MCNSYTSKQCSENKSEINLSAAHCVGQCVDLSWVRFQVFFSKQNSEKYSYTLVVLRFGTRSAHYRHTSKNCFILIKDLHNCSFCVASDSYPAILMPILNVRASNMPLRDVMLQFGVTWWFLCGSTVYGGWLAGVQSQLPALGYSLESFEVADATKLIPPVLFSKC